MKRSRQRKNRIRELRSFALLACAGLALTTAACGSSGNSDQPSKAAVTGVNPNETYYWVGLATGLPLFVQNDFVALQSAAKMLGVRAKVAGPTDISAEKAIATLNQVCSSHPAGVMAFGFVTEFSSGIRNCMAEGVPVVTVDLDLPGSGRLTFVGSDWRQLGVGQANALKKALPNGGEVASIISASSNASQTAAVQGLKDTLAGTNIHVVAVEEDGGVLATAAQKTAALLAAHPHLSAIAAFDSQAGPGVLQALKEAGKTGKVLVTSVETADNSYLKNVASGDVLAVTVQQRALMTTYALETLFTYRHGPKVLGSLPNTVAPPVPAAIDTSYLLVTKDNIAAIESHIH